MSARVKALRSLFTAEEASIIYMNVDGWLDAGAGAQGRGDEERTTLERLCELMRTRMIEGE